MPCFHFQEDYRKYKEKEILLNRNYKHIDNFDDKWKNIYDMIDV